MGRFVVHKVSGLNVLISYPKDDPKLKERGEKIAENFKRKGIPVALRGDPYKGTYLTFMVEHNKTIVSSTLVWDDDPPNVEPVPVGQGGK